MIQLPQTIKIIWGYRNRIYYIEKGYTFTDWGDEFNVDVFDLPELAQNKIIVKCDCCNETYETKYVSYINNRKKHNDEDYCKKCCMAKTNNEIYGTYCAAKSNKVKEKTKQTCLKKYGTESYMKTNEFKEKAEQIFLERYGVKNPFQSEEIKEKIKQTNLEKYGVEYSSQYEPLKEQRVINMKNTMYQNGNAPCSKQQEYIYNLLGGSPICKLNYPINRCSLDIAFPEEMIYIEYDGSGHDLSVKLGSITQEEFKKYEMNRQYYLNSLGWRIIRIISKNDLLPEDNEIIELINNAKEHFDKNHTWYKINLDENYILNSNGKQNIIIKNLRKIKEEN